MSTVDVVDQQFVSGILSRWCLSKIVLHVTELYSCDHYQTPGKHKYQSASGAPGSTAATVLQHHTDRLAAYRSGHAAFVDPTPLTRMCNDAASHRRLETALTGSVVKNMQKRFISFSHTHFPLYRLFTNDASRCAFNSHTNFLAAH